MTQSLQALLDSFDARLKTVEAQLGGGALPPPPGGGGGGGDDDDDLPAQAGRGRARARARAPHTHPLRGVGARSPSLSL